LTGFITETEYTIKVHTGDGATDASVYVTIVGDRGETGEKQLIDSDSDDNTFESNQVSVVYHCRGFIIS
jgi:PLAT/LH2 domain